MIQPIHKPTPKVKQRKRLQSRPRLIPTSIKEAVFERDGRSCQHCGRYGGALDAHHIQRRSQGGPDAVANLIAVCRPCHSWLHDNPAEAKRRGFLS